MTVRYFSDTKHDSRCEIIFGACGELPLGHAGSSRWSFRQREFPPMRGIPVGSRIQKMRGTPVGPMGVLCWELPCRQAPCNAEPSHRLKAFESQFCHAALNFAWIPHTKILSSPKEQTDEFDMCNNKKVTSEPLYREDLGWPRRANRPDPDPSEEGTPANVSTTFTWKPRPECGLDCLVCAIFARQRPPLPLHR